MRHKVKRPRIYRKKSAVVQGSAFPGYPHYPEQEDLMMSSAKREEIDLEKLPERAPVNKTSSTTSAQDGSAETTSETPRTEADISKDDLAALGPKEGDMDMGDDEIMNLSGE